MRGSTTVFGGSCRPARNARTDLVTSVADAAIINFQ
jgi:hypothetical protein